jgi:hypothetical protein
VDRSEIFADGPAAAPEVGAAGADGAAEENLAQAATEEDEGDAFVRRRLPINGPDGVVLFTPRKARSTRRYLLREVFD